MRAFMVLSIAIGFAVSTPMRADAAFPAWAREARLAGAGFDRSMSDAEVDAKLRQLAADGVTVVVASAGTGSSYAAWVDELEFREEVAFMRDRVTAVAHTRGLKIVWYLTGLELVCEECADSGRSPLGEHADWLQVGRNGSPLQFSAVSGVFWLNENDLDVWLSPESPYRQFYLGRIRDIAAVGADGLWIDTAYLVNALGKNVDLWPSYDEASRAAFQSAWGQTTIPAKNWADPAWRRFVRWRIDSVTRFLREISATALAVDANLVLFAENWACDTYAATQNAQDALEISSIPQMTTVHEIGPVDQSGSGMGGASAQQWRDYALMVKFAGASNQARPAWVLTYAGAVDDSVREAGVHLGEAANFYEAKGPRMLDDSTGSRPTVLPWIAAHSAMVFASQSMAKVAVWFSPRTRDFVDGDAGGEGNYDDRDAAYLRAYRETGRQLLRDWIPFDIITGRSALAALRGYQWIIVPGASCISDDEASLFSDYVAGGGKLVVTGDSGSRNEWGEPRTSNVLTGIPTQPTTSVEGEVITTDLGATERESILFGVRTGRLDGQSFVLVVLTNTDPARTFANVGLTVRLPSGFVPTSATWDAPTTPGGSLSFAVREGRVDLVLPSLDKSAAIVLTGPRSLRRRAARH